MDTSDDEAARLTQIEAMTKALRLLDELKEIVEQINAGIESGELRLDNDSPEELSSNPEP
jgi:hypothetical protein